MKDDNCPETKDNRNNSSIDNTEETNIKKGIEKCKIGTTASMNNKSIIATNEVGTTTDDDHQSVVATPNVHYISKTDTSQKGDNVENISEKESVKNTTEKLTNFDGDNIVRKNDVIITTDNGHQSVIATPNVHHISKTDISHKGDNVENTSEKESVKNSTEKSTNFENDDIVRKNDVITTTDDDHQIVVATPNVQHISKSDTSHKGENVENTENTSEKEPVQTWSDKLRKFITTEDDCESSLDDFHDAYEASPYDQYQNQTTNTNSK